MDEKLQIVLKEYIWNVKNVCKTKKSLWIGILDIEVGGVVLIHGKFQ